MGTGAVCTAPRPATLRGVVTAAGRTGRSIQGVSGAYPPELGLEEAGGRGEPLEGEHSAPPSWQVLVWKGSPVWVAVTGCRWLQGPEGEQEDGTFSVRGPRCL